MIEFPGFGTSVLRAQRGHIQDSMYSGDEGHGKVGRVDDVVYMIIFVWRFIDGVLYGFDSWVMDRHAYFMVL